ncbi:unnamed protein product [Pelagomonas calceolata]|uniref:Uncharacterized protein n=2 Tax=Pelagomonas calceolata TaxID=35677 RepID=A0A8J2SE53_9STRA|nr:unnamed protein product [Pelagomonas calceolata]
MPRLRPRPGYAFEAPAAAVEKPAEVAEPVSPPAPPFDAWDAPADAFAEPAEAEEPAESSADDSADAFEKLADAFEDPGTPPPPRKTPQELAAALAEVSDKLEPAAAPEPKSPRPWSFRRTLHSPSRTPKRFFGSPKPNVEPKKLWEDGDASDAGDAPRVSLEELDEFVDVVALNKRTGKRSIIRLARGTVMSDVFAAYAQHTKSDAKKLVFVRGDGTEKGRSLSPKARVADLRSPAAARSPARTPRKKREPKKSFDEQIWNRAVAIGHDAWDEKHFGSLDAGESVALPLNRAEIRPDVEYMELSIDLGEEEPPPGGTPLRSLRKQASRVTGVTGAFSGKSPPPSPGGERPGTPLRNLRKQASKLSGVTGAFSGKSPE